MTASRMRMHSSTNCTGRFNCWPASLGQGGRREELAPGIQSFPLGHYIIFYRAVASAIEIVRVLHGARDIENIFEG